MRHSRVSAAGVQSDTTIYNDSWTDDSWDAVWQSAVKIDDTGWSAEMRIPFSQLRFPKAAQLTFGLNAMRYIQRKKEEAWMVQVPKTENGLASRMGHLDGLDGVSPHRTVEFMPYVVSRAEYVEPEPGDPFNDGARAFAGTGVDLKYRVSSSLSLDGTINPDFGQVEVDPAVVNLTAFETFFEEKRPFFIEGANIFSNFGRGGANNFWGFNRADPMLFYSRRIGRAPQGSASGDFVEQPTSTTILGAAKLTGKTKKGWSLGTLDAVTGREWAKAVTGLEQTESEVEPLSNYFVGRAEKELGRRAAIGVLGTAVNRDLRAPDLSADLPAQAYVGGVDGYYFLNAKREWVVNGRIAGSHLTGSTDAITGLQNASQRYFGRPDATHVELDPTATSLGGWTGSLNLNRNAGVHQVNAALWSVSPGFDSSDAGFTFAADRAGMHAVYQWRNPKVNRFARSRFLALAKFYTWNFARELQGDGFFAIGNVELKNYWSVFANGGLFRDTQDDRATRGGPSMLNPSAATGSIGVESDGRKTVSIGGNANFNRNDVGGWSRGLSLNVRYRPAASLEISAGPGFDSPSQPRAVRRHLRGSDRRRHLRIALRVLDAGSEGVQPSDPRELRDVAEDVAAGVHAAAGVGGALHRVQAVRQATDLRLHPARRRSRQPDLRPGREALYRRPRGRRRFIPVRRPRLQLQVAAPECDLSMGVEAGIGDLRGLDRAAPGRCLSRPVSARTGSGQHVHRAGKRRADVQAGLLVSKIGSSFQFPAAELGTGNYKLCGIGAEGYAFVAGRLLAKRPVAVSRSSHDASGRPAQEGRRHQPGQHFAARPRLEIPQPCRLFRREPQSRHFVELSSHALQDWLHLHGSCLSSGW